MRLPYVTYIVLFQYEAALAVDAIEVVTRALKGMITANPKIFQSTIRRKEVYNYNKTRGVPCTTQPPLHWMHGDDIMEQIKMVRCCVLCCCFTSMVNNYGHVGTVS